MGDRAFARARAAGKNETEAGHAAPKPRLTSPSAFQQNIGTRKMTRERNVSCTQPSRQPNARGATDMYAHAPTRLRYFSESVWDFSESQKTDGTNTY